MELFFVHLKVRPRAQHPDFHNVTAGFLCLAIFSRFPEQAVKIATAIARLLPYKIIGDSAGVDPETGLENPEYKKCAEMARVVGLGVLFARWRPGGLTLEGEHQFETVPWLGDSLPLS